MKKNLLKITLTVFGAVVLTISALATTNVSFLPTSIKVTSGQNFNLIVAVNPQGVNNYTAKIELDYPADILEVKSFSFGSNWMALSQSGYDLIDNTNGVLIKTAGYPGGLSSSATFGTVSFYTKKAGSGIIKVGNGALALDANNQNVISGLSEVIFTVTAPTVPITPKPAIPTPVAPISEPTAKQPIEQLMTQQVPQPSLLAAIGIVLTLGTNNIWISILMGIIILVILIYAIYSFIQRKRKNF